MGVFSILSKLPRQKPATTSELLNEKEAAARLAVSVQTLARIRKREEIGFAKISGRFYYSPRDLADYIERKSFKPCHKDASKSASIGFPNTANPASGKPLGSIGGPDKQSAHLLAQTIFGKPKSA